jgi:FkbM family methyltransferase
MQNPQATTDETSPPAKRPRWRLRPAQWVILALSLVVGGLLHLRCDQLLRRLQFRLTGEVQAAGLNLRLDPTDKMITEMILRDGSYEHGETELLSGFLHPGDTFIDVGANIGWYTLVASRIVGAKGRVFAFEPAPGSFELLACNAALNHCDNARLEPKALSDKHTSISLNLGVTNKGHNSILKTPDTGESVSVEAVSLDEYLGSDPGDIALIKIDTEGAEGFVLAGMEQTLRKHPRTVLFMEFYPTLIRQAGFEPLSLLQRFHDSGYEIQIIDDEQAKPEPLPEARLKALATDLEKRREYVNLIIKRPA